MKETVEAPRKLSQVREMILQLHKPLFDAAEALITICECCAGNSSALGTIERRDEKYPQPLRLRDAGSKSFRLSFRLFDRTTHILLNSSKPAFISFAVTLR
jgi:hypothetical protein